MSEIIGVGSTSLLDLNDAIVAGVPPVNPTLNSLWIDSSIVPNPMLKKWNGTKWVSIGELDPNLSETITNIQEKLGNLANDGLITFDERGYIKDKLTEIIGYVMSDGISNLPASSTLNSSARGGFYSVRKSALNAGIDSSNSTYIKVATEWDNLKNYLNGLSPRPWDLSTSNKDTNTSVTKSTFRDKWLQYYLSVDALATATAEKLKQNVDDIEIGTRNLAIGTAKMDGFYNYGSANVTVTESYPTPIVRAESTGGTGGVYQTPQYRKMQLIEGEVYTLSFEVRGNIPFLNYIYIMHEGTGNQTVPAEQLASETEFNRVSRKFSKLYDAKYSGVMISAQDMIIGDWFEVKNIKVEKGNKATDWTPAPEDTQQQIDDVTGRVSSVEQKVKGDSIITSAMATEKWDIAMGKIDTDAKGYAKSAESNAKSYATSAIDDIEIGVRNYFSLSKFQSLAPESWVVSAYVYHFKLEPNTNYTLSSNVPEGVDSSETCIYYNDSGTSTNGVWEGKPLTKETDGNGEIFVAIPTGRIYTSELVNGTYWVKLEKGNKATDWMPAPEDTQDKIDNLSGLTKVKYIRDWLNGNTANTSDHWVEIQAMVGETNIALNKPVTSSIPPTRSGLELLTDGDTDSANYFTVGAGLQYVQIDLGEMRDDIDTLNIYHYYLDNRTFHSTKTEVSEDGINWITVFDSAVDGEYQESSNGNTIPINLNVSSSLRDVGSELVLIKTQNNNIEQIVSPEGINTTITESVFYENYLKDLEGKAGIEAIGDLVTKEELDGSLSDVDGAISDAIAGIDFEPYVTTQELEKTSKNITAKFSATGGMNLVKNSVGFADFDFWNVIYPSNVSTISNQALDILGFGAGFDFAQHPTQYTRIEQDVSVIAGVPYTLSWYINKTGASDNSWGAIIEDGAYLETKTYDKTYITNGYQSDSITFIPKTNLITVRIMSQTEATFTGIMLSIGDVALQWSLATGELYNTNIRMDINGIRVSQLDADRKEVGYTQITPDEFAGYYDSNEDGNFEKVFYLNKDETVTKKFRAKEEITMGTIKIIKVEKGGNMGWAFVPIIDEY